MEWVIFKMREYGSLNYAEKMMEKFASEAKIYFQKELGFLAKKPARDYLEYLPDFLTKRDH